MAEMFRRIRFSFSVQLLLLHLKRNHFLVLGWFILFCFVYFLIGERYGIPLLFLDPEYLGHVSFLSYFILGVAFGAYFMVWNVTSYILHARHFPFLATLQRPFGVYSLNNSLIPLAFLIAYLVQLLIFQRQDGLQDWGIIALRTIGLLCGIILFISISMAYFFSTNKNVFQLFRLDPTQHDLQDLPFEGKTWQMAGQPHSIHIDSYINHQLSVKLARKAGHYPAYIIEKVYRQHHVNALFIELTSLLLLLVLGHLIDYPVFRIPAASSILLLFAIGLMLIGAVSYWLKGWKVLISVLAIILLDILIGHGLLQYRNQAFGIDPKQTGAVYDLESLQQLHDPARLEADKQHMLQVLNNWRAKFPEDAPPKMIFVNCSGGGLRATMFVMDALQKADSITNGQLMQHSMMMTGASGGMIAAAYYRELYRMQIAGYSVNRYDDLYLQKISSDLLNAIAYTMVVNDLFFPWQSYTHEGISYRKDRGYMFEKVLHENTDSLLFHPVSSSYQDEYEARIPLLLMYPTIVNDERKLFIGAQPFSYLGIPAERLKDDRTPEYDGIDIRQLLGNEQADRLLLSSALRMSCTFPYILPNVYLPTDPQIEVMDAGIRDNYGIESSVRFATTFRHWIDSNTSGIVVLNIRGLENSMPIRENVSSGILEKVISPIGNLYLNWVEVQDYQHDLLLHYLEEIMQTPVDVLTIAYEPTPGSRRASLSFHLTEKEKQDVRASVTGQENMQVYRQLGNLLSPF